MVHELIQLPMSMTTHIGSQTVSLGHINYCMTINSEDSPTYYACNRVNEFLRSTVQSSGIPNRRIRLHQGISCSSQQTATIYVTFLKAHIDMSMDEISNL